MISAFSTSGQYLIHRRRIPVIVYSPNPTSLNIGSLQTGNTIPAGMTVSPLNDDGTVSSLFSVGTGDFTFDVHILATSLKAWESSGNSGGYVVTFPGVGNPGISLGVSQGYFVLESRVPGNITAVNVPVTINLNTWYHIAIQRISGVMYIFFNGTRTTAGVNFNTFSIGNTFILGCRFSSEADAVLGGTTLSNTTFDGRLANIRFINKGIYTNTTYTPPTGRFGISSSAGTNILAVNPNELLCLINSCTPAYSYSTTGIGFIDVTSFRRVGSSYFYDISYNYINNNGTNFSYPTINTTSSPSFATSNFDFTMPPTNTQMIPLINPSFVIRSGSSLTYKFRVVQTRVLLNGFYTIRASSIFDAGVPVSNAFNTPGTTDKWASLSGRYNASTGVYTGSSSLGGLNGEWISVQFPFSFITTKYALYPHAWTTRQIVEHSFIASNDGTSWVTLRTVTIGFGNTQAWTNYTVSTGTAYSYYAIVVTKLVGSNDGTASCHFAVFN